MKQIHWDCAHINELGNLLVNSNAGNDWNEAFSIFNGTTLIVKKCLSAVFASFCVPNSFVSDKGSEFPCHNFKACCKYQETIRTESLIYHSQSNGQTERAISTAKHALKFRAKTFQWQSLGFCNNWCIEALFKQEVKALAQLVSGRKINLPSIKNFDVCELIKKVTEQIFHLSMQYSLDSTQSFKTWQLIQAKSFSSRAEKKEEHFADMLKLN